jgi:hypothetical protein
MFPADVRPGGDPFGYRLGASIDESALSRGDVAQRFSPITGFSGSGRFQP